MRTMMTSKILRNIRFPNRYVVAVSRLLWLTLFSDVFTPA